MFGLLYSTYLCIHLDLTYGTPNKRIRVFVLSVLKYILLFVVLILLTYTTHTHPLLGPRFYIACAGLLHVEFSISCDRGWLRSSKWLQRVSQNPWSAPLIRFATPPPHIPVPLTGRVVVALWVILQESSSCHVTGVPETE